MLLAACGNDAGEAAANGEPMTKLSVGVFAGSSALPLYVAHTQGIFNKHNIDSTLVPGQGAPALLASVLGGSTQVALGVPSSTFAAIDQEGGVGVLPPYQNLDFELLAMDSAAKGDITKLAGKTIGVTALGGATDVWLRGLLTEAGMDPAKDVTIIASGGLPATDAALQQGSIDAAVITGPLTPVLMQGGLKLVTVVSALEGKRTGVNDWGIEIMWVASEKYFESHPKLSGQYCAALADTIKWMADPANGAAGATIVEKELAVPAATAPAVWETARKLWTMEMDEDRWNKNLEYFDIASSKTEMKTASLGC